MSREIIVAEPHGYCGNERFGVKGAIFKAQEAARENPGQTYVLGEIVHNKHVCDWLEREHRVRTVHSLEEIPEGETLVIRAHGTVPETYVEARERGLRIVDATCPLVAQVHRKVKALASGGKRIVYIASSKNHDEAVGVAGEAPEAVTLTTLEELGELEISDPESTVVITQTTLSVLETKEKLERLKEKYPKVTVKPHLCRATTERQEAVIKLAKEVGFVVIVGSPTSSNSKRLREVAEAAGAEAYIVDTSAELDPAWFEGVLKIAVSSGASTPEWLLEEVIEKIKSF